MTTKYVSKIIYNKNTNTYIFEKYIDNKKVTSDEFSNSILHVQSSQILGTKKYEYKQGNKLIVVIEKVVDK